MTRTTSRNRKLVYAGGIAVLVIPIVVLGMPGDGQRQSGGVLAHMRADPELDLGETTLGDVDPASATMTFVLLGFRGLAANQLWLQADEQKDTKQWAALRTTVNSITKLQPHFRKVWDFQGWNLAYNVSVEWDDVRDRYYWVKEGGKFLMEGTRRTRRHPELFWNVGRVLGAKIGRSDEWRQFRRFFKSDPNVEKFNGGQDPELASDEGGRLFADNYLAAQHWFGRANGVDDVYNQRMMARPVFRSYPTRSQFDYAGALHREGQFDDVSRQAWADAYDQWTTDFGRDEIFDTVYGGKVFLEASAEELAALAKEDEQTFSIDAKFRAVDSTKRVVNYDYWKAKADSERRPETEAAHRELYEGRRLYHLGFNGSTTVFQLADGFDCSRIDELQLPEPRAAILEQLCASDLVWLVDPTDSELRPERRAELERILRLLKDGARVTLASEIARQLDVSIDDVVDGLFELRNEGHLTSVSEAKAILTRGMEKYERVLAEFGDLLEEDRESIDEALMAVLYFRKLHEIAEEPLPASYPLKRYWDREWDKDKYHGQINEVRRRFIRAEALGGIE